MCTCQKENLTYLQTTSKRVLGNPKFIVFTLRKKGLALSVCQAFLTQCKLKSFQKVRLL